MPLIIKNRKDHIIKMNELNGGNLGEIVDESTMMQPYKGMVVHKVYDPDGKNKFYAVIGTNKSFEANSDIAVRIIPVGSLLEVK